MCLEEGFGFFEYKLDKRLVMRWVYRIVGFLVEELVREVFEKGRFVSFFVIR